MFTLIIRHEKNKEKTKILEKILQLRFEHENILMKNNFIQLSLDNLSAIIDNRTVPCIVDGDNGIQKVCDKMEVTFGLRYRVKQVSVLNL